MNRIALLITLIFPFVSNAQMYMRKKQNFGVYAQYNIGLESPNSLEGTFYLSLVLEAARLPI